MITDVDGFSVAEELRGRAGAFVNQHTDLWVTAEDDGTLVLAGSDPAALFRAAADWLSEGPAYTIVNVQWNRRQNEPIETLRLRLQHPGPAANAHADTAVI